VRRFTDISGRREPETHIHRRPLSRRLHHERQLSYWMDRFPESDADVVRTSRLTTRDVHRPRASAGSAGNPLTA